mmetsp:Transcript_17615/g.41421  ORF Transcript_17615/g.41421 Transcript_17615/m.41421 type:complete len:259 (-) Transcript_17615:961-1737(-)
MRQSQPSRLRQVTIFLVEHLLQLVDPRIVVAIRAVVIGTTLFLFIWQALLIALKKELPRILFHHVVIGARCFLFGTKEGINVVCKWIRIIVHHVLIFGVEAMHFGIQAGIEYIDGGYFDTSVLERCLIRIFLTPPFGQDIAILALGVIGLSVGLQQHRGRRGSITRCRCQPVTLDSEVHQHLARCWVRFNLGNGPIDKNATGRISFQDTGPLLLQQGLRQRLGQCALIDSTPTGPGKGGTNGGDGRPGFVGCRRASRW